MVGSLKITPYKGTIGIIILYFLVALKQMVGSLKGSLKGILTGAYRGGVVRLMDKILHDPL